MKTKRYSDVYETDSFSVTGSFTGSDEWPKSNPVQTDVVLECRNSAHVLWNKKFGDLVMPDGAWNGFKLIVGAQDKVFTAISNRLIEIDMTTGNTKWEVETGNTPIAFLLMSGSQIIVQNGYFNFQHDEGANLASYDFQGREKWRCILEGNDAFANSPRIDRDGKLFASTWSSYDCEIDKLTGEILARKFTK